jgi:hypothetical protein
VERTCKKKAGLRDVEHAWNLGIKLDDLAEEKEERERENRPLF